MPVLIPKSTTGTPLLFFLVQSADHITALTGASPTVKIGKNGAAGAAPSGAVTEIDSTNLPGWYQVAGNATDTNTAGPIALHATAASADPCDMVAAQVIDPATVNMGVNLINIAGSAVSTSTAQLGVNAVNIAGQAAALDANNLLKVDTEDWKGTAVSAPATAGIPDINVKNIVNTAAAVDANNLLKVDVEDWKASAVNALISGKVDALTNIRTGTAQAGAAGTITLDAGASATDNLYRDHLVLLLSATGAGQVRPIIGYVGATKVATVTPNWATNPDVTSVFALIPSAFADVVSWLDVAVASANLQTGDAFARLGVPAGATVSADIAAVKSDSAAIKTQTDKFTFTVANQVDANVIDWKSATAPAMTGDAFARLGAPVGASISADIAEIEGETDTLLAGVIVTTNNDKTGYSITSNVKKNSTGRITFIMTDSTTHNPVTGLVVTPQRSIDGAALVGTVNAVTEISNGLYTLVLAAADTNGNDIVYRFTAPGADDLNIEYVTQP